jgi:arsenate reductase
MKSRTKIVVYEKPTCSKCREVKRVLTEKGLEFESVNYIETPLSAADLKQLLRQAGLKPHEILRVKEDAYKNHVAGKRLSDEQLIVVMAKHPEIIQRPIVVREGKAVLARETEKLRELGIQ